MSSKSNQIQMPLLYHSWLKNVFTRPEKFFIFLSNTFRTRVMTAFQNKWDFGRRLNLQLSLTTVFTISRIESSSDLLSVTKPYFQPKPIFQLKNLSSAALYSLCRREETPATLDQNTRWPVSKVFQCKELFRFSAQLIAISDWKKLQITRLNEVDTEGE